MNYSFAKTLRKGIWAFILFAIPQLISMFVIAMPEYASLTIGGVLMMISNFLKVKGGLRLP